MSFKNEKIVETKSCQQCRVDFDITDKDLEFYDKVSPVFNGDKFQIPIPVMCPECRHQRRLSFRNERKLYKRKCDSTQKDIISVYSPDKPYIVYNSDFWWSDNWNPLDYGFDFDETQSFSFQFDRLMKTTPQLGTIYINSQNCDFTSFVINSQNCYKSSGIVNSEDCLYSQFGKSCENILDSLVLYETQQSYQGIDSYHCYNCHFFNRCTDCKNCSYVDDCIDCESCIDCHGLVGKKYYFKNKDVGKEKIEQLMSEGIHNLTPEIDKGVRKSVNIQQSNDCTGDGIYNSKNCVDCFDIVDVEDSKYIYFTPHGRTSYDCTYTSPTGVEYSYGACSSMGTGMYMTFRCWEGSNTFYSIGCDSCNDIFGCTGLRNAQYCIFNKQYTKQEYHKLVPKIIKRMQQDSEWGEYFPSSLSPFGYHETVAAEYFPFTKQEARSRGFNWSDYEPPFPKVEKTIPASKLPENIADIPDDILNWAITCEATGKAFLIVPEELEFYRKHNLPIPKIHPDQRHFERISARNPRKLFGRNCDKCGDDMQTTYSPDHKDRVYCESCYEKEVY